MVVVDEIVGDGKVVVGFVEQILKWNPETRVVVVAREVERGAVGEGGKLWGLMGGNAVVAFRMIDGDDLDDIVELDGDSEDEEIQDWDDSRLV